MNYKNLQQICQKYLLLDQETRLPKRSSVVTSMKSEI